MLMYTWDAITTGPVRQSGVHCDKGAALEAAATALLGSEAAIAVLVTQVHPPLNLVSGYAPTGNSWTGRRRGARVAWTAATVNVTRDGLSRPAPPGHPVEVLEGSAYRVGAGNCAGTAALLANQWHYPVEALCGACLGVVRCEDAGGEWVHTGRQAGQAPAAAAAPTAAAAGPAREDRPGPSRAGGEG